MAKSLGSGRLVLLVCLAAASLTRVGDVSLPGLQSLRTNGTKATASPQGARGSSLPGARPLRNNETNVAGAVPPRRRAWVVLVENRDLLTSRPYGYYTLAMWQLYTSIVPDCEVLVYNSSALCRARGAPLREGRQNCTGYDGRRMASYWMKVLAVLNAMEESDEGDLVVFMDTDMQVLNAHFTQSILELEQIQSFLRSNRTMLVIEEHESFWSTMVKREGCYRAPIVSNVFAVVNNDVGRRMMRTWWQSAGRITKMDKSGWSGRRFLWDWPWEQERLAAYYDAAPELFFAVNQSRTYMGWMHHGPLSGVAFQWKHDIIRSLNETLMNQTRTFSLHNGSSYEELVSYLYQQIDVRPLRTEVGQLSPGLTGFWDADWGRV